MLTRQVAPKETPESYLHLFKEERAPVLEEISKSSVEKVTASLGIECGQALQVVKDSFAKLEKAKEEMDPIRMIADKALECESVITGNEYRKAANSHCYNVADIADECIECHKKIQNIMDTFGVNSEPKPNDDKVAYLRKMAKWATIVAAEAATCSAEAESERLNCVKRATMITYFEMLKHNNATIQEAVVELESVKDEVQRITEYLEKAIKEGVADLEELGANCDKALRNHSLRKVFSYQFEIAYNFVADKFGRRGTKEFFMVPENVAETVSDFMEFKGHHREECHQKLDEMARKVDVSFRRCTELYKKMEESNKLATRANNMLLEGLIKGKHDVDAVVKDEKTPESKENLSVEETKTLLPSKRLNVLSQDDSAESSQAKKSNTEEL